jgi:ribA/ribD-fused uncharacterized protein
MTHVEGFEGEYRFLSNFIGGSVILTDPDGTPRTYKTVEHAYQAAKTMDLEERAHIRTLDRPSQAKKYGKSVTLRPNWQDVRLDIMEVLVRQKFQLPGFKSQLLKIDGDIIESNRWHDQFWGDCWCTYYVECRTPGQNHMGKILMKIRDELVVDAASG